MGFDGPRIETRYPPPVLLPPFSWLGAQDRVTVWFVTTTGGGGGLDPPPPPLQPARCADAARTTAASRIFMDPPGLLALPMLPEMLRARIVQTPVGVSYSRFVRVSTRLCV